ncbi:branched-chain amino acid ABC transporter permease [Pimelobacter simplex]|uniref:Branched-chain amino acid transport system permease protein LivM n=1 Tax=Nocardioides simplex TaxID=2045 RepID=A0A0C5WXH9_NOCSI|nr:branched-chain amino acid ABC transporter permease [Pimelobacter simplex]AJR17983.1 Branched-chain amino acid transport system permease protein LivM [Pimelobacter simplex]MCG8150546.1 branched-chain amino acid ABC transporter permease [Pimelobacter simplex]GEB15069.1 branched-chain amino acid ABC transporter permease [Pimelobacter simplex]SFM86879.1 amino acid/amide ABC transporter membrane protein 2, HAAT family [Pimelobacter simplex]
MKNLNRLLAAVQTPAILVGLVLLAALVGVTGDVTTARVATLALVSVVFVVGLSVFSGNSGVMSFGHVMFMAAGAYTTAYLTIPVPLKKTLFSDLPGWLSWLAEVHSSFPVALLAGGLVAAVVGLVTAPVVARLSGLQSGIATLAMLLITYNVLNSWTEVTRGSSSMIGIPRGTTTWWAFGVAAAAVVVAWLYRCSRSGLQLRASREDFWAAQASGIAVGRHRATAWVLSALVCGLAGALYAGYLTSFNVNGFFLTATFSFVVMIVLGGYLSLSGAVVGALAVSALQEVLRRFQDGQFTGGNELPAGVADLIVAAVLLVVLVKAPYGLMGVRELRLPRLTRRGRGDAERSADATAKEPVSVA